MKEEWDKMQSWYQAHLLAYDQCAAYDEFEKEKMLYKALGAKVK